VENWDGPNDIDLYENYLRENLYQYERDSTHTFLQISEGMKPILADLISANENLSKTNKEIIKSVNILKNTKEPLSDLEEKNKKLENIQKSHNKLMETMERIEKCVLPAAIENKYRDINVKIDFSKNEKIEEICNDSDVIMMLYRRKLVFFLQ
jgi:hypothetical protein